MSTTQTKVIVAVIAAIMTIGVLAVTQGQSVNAALVRGGNGGIGGAGGAGGVGGNGGVNVIGIGQDSSGGDANGAHGGNANGGNACGFFCGANSHNH